MIGEQYPTKNRIIYKPPEYHL